jgi:DNA-directed RNA polymerase subunit RPC12/RpoP
MMYNIFVNETNKEKEMNKLDALKKKCSRCGSTALDLYTDLTSFQTVWDCYNCGHKEPVIPTSADQIIVKDKVAPAMCDDVEKDLMDIEYEIEDLCRYAKDAHELGQMEYLRGIITKLVSVIRRMR